MSGHGPGEADELSAAGLAALGPGNACDREPIHLTGAIQPHGVLLAIDASGLLLSAASANASMALTGDSAMDVSTWLGRPLAEVVDPAVYPALQGLATLANPHEAVPAPVGLASKYTMTGHRSGDLVLLEFEPFDGGDEALSTAFYQCQRQLIKDLDAAQTTEQVCDLAARQVRSMTGYDRVMIYQFAADAHGTVVAESCRSDLDRYLGLHYPAGDIPRQARALYLRNPIRVIPDVGYQPVPLVAGGAGPALPRLDLGMAALRSVSPVHLQYLQNMGVSATMTVSLVVEGRLWGMIAAHHTGPKLFGPTGRLACETLGQLVSLRLRAVQRDEEERAVADYGRMAAQVATAMAASESAVTGAAAAADALLGMVEADGAVLQIGSERIGLGIRPDDAVIDNLVSILGSRVQAVADPVATDRLAEFVDSDHEASATLTEDLAGLAGAMYLSLTGRDDGFVLWFRAEHVKSVRWAGQHESDIEGRQTHPLTPRTSFAEWQEVVRGRSRPWSVPILRAAAELAEAMPDIILHRSQNRLVRLALHDPLTALPNRLMLGDQLEALLAPRQVEGGAEDLLGVLFVDLDGFKNINDTCGHAAGDDLLIQAAQRLAAAVRKQDVVCRLGGDEFVILLTGSDRETGAAVAQRVVDDFRETFVIEGWGRRLVTASLGLAWVPIGTDPGEALRRADVAVYHAKRNGRNQVALYDFAGAMPASIEQQDSEMLLQAITNGQLLAFYQPILDLQGPGSPRITGFEALARWRHPTRGNVPPDEFVAMAEKSGLIDRLGDAILTQALAWLRTWSDQTLTVAVNVSVLQLTRPGFVEEVLSRLMESGVPAHRLYLEITESQMMEQPHLAMTALAELSAAGIRIAIDDFGTGFSSLAYVRDMPASIVKIDRSLISGLPHQARDVSVVRWAIQLAHELGMRTIAEGVETDEQLTTVRELGSDHAQGFLIGRPLPADQVTIEWDAGGSKAATRSG